MTNKTTRLSTRQSPTWSRPRAVLLTIGLLLSGPSFAATASTTSVPAGQARQQPIAAVTNKATTKDKTSATEIFTDAAASLGVDFVHFNGMSGEYYMIENLGGGGALLDYDNDGDLDMYLVQGNMMGPGKTLADAKFPPRPGESLTDRLYRNDLSIRADGTRSLHFTDVTKESGINAPGYGMGVTVGDIDNDGWLDIYVNNFGNNQLWHNNGDGTFSDVTGKAGVGDPRLSVSSAFLDYDQDGWLDLFVSNYVEFDPKKNRICHAPNGARDYCSPLIYDPQMDGLYRNRGDGTFEDVSATAGITRAYGTALGVVVADFNGDAWIDIYVANDGMANQLWINQKDGTFRDEGLLSGTAVNMEGAAEASMGVDAADFDGDGDEDLFMTHLLGETNTIYVNSGEGWFEDRTVATGLGLPSKAYTSFGTSWLDYNNDGWLDLMIANGGVNNFLSLVLALDPYPLHQTNQLFLNLGSGRFKEVTHESGSVFTLSEVSRGLASGDLDNDGDVDVLLVNNSGPARVLINNIGNRNHWVGLRLLNARNRDALGARVVVQAKQQAPLRRRVRADGSYASANDPRVLVGLGVSNELPAIRVHWTSGRVEEWAKLRSDRYTTLREGDGSEVRKPGAIQ